MSYLDRVARKWGSLVWYWAGAAGVVGGLSLLDAVNWPGWALLLLGVASIIFAQWRVWVDEHAAHEAARDELRDILTSVRFGLAVERVDAHLRIQAETHEERLDLNLVLTNTTDLPLKFRMESCELTVDDGGSVSMPENRVAENIVRPHKEGGFRSGSVKAPMPRRLSYTGRFSYVLVYGPIDLPLEPGQVGAHRLRHSFKWDFSKHVNSEEYGFGSADVEGPVHEPL
jgi:hypothetical protein